VKGNHADVNGPATSGDVGNGVGDDCETVLFCDACASQADGTIALDDDGDFVLDNCDNCRSVPNTSQANADGDAFGEACEPDTDRDGAIDDVDNCLDLPNPSQANCNLDAEIANGLLSPRGDACDPVPCTEATFTSRVERRGPELVDTTSVFWDVTGRPLWVTRDEVVVPAARRLDGVPEHLVLRIPIASLTPER
jgi:hypothetical protein